MSAVRGTGYLQLNFGSGLATIVGLTNMTLKITGQNLDASDLTTDMAPLNAKVGYNWEISGEANFQDDQAAQYAALVAAAKSASTYPVKFVESSTGVYHEGSVHVSLDQHQIATRQLQKLSVTLVGNGVLTTTTP